MIVVLSLDRPRLEDVLAARGEKIMAIIPESMRLARESGNPGYPIRAIDNWDNYNELACIAGELEAQGVTAVATIDEPCIRAAYIGLASHRARVEAAVGRFTFVNERVGTHIRVELPVQREGMLKRPLQQTLPHRLLGRGGAALGDDPHSPNRPTCDPS